ncbi:MAG: AAA family ATPase, partial [Clostridia bacterium]|nr:AAA family ATPase [Clostridia bacterium]
FIGENGTGKTHLLKLLYLFTFDLEEDFGMRLFQEIFSDELLDVIRNKDDANKAVMSCTIDGDVETVDAIMWPFVGDKVPSIGGKVGVALNKPEAVFIPAKEMLSHSKGLLALDRERKIPFDKTLIDIVAKTQLGQAKKQSPVKEKLMRELSQVIGGTVGLEQDVFYIIKETGLKVEFSMEAEGLRKLGLLWRLLENGLLTEGTVLLWDEPDGNVNPAKIPILVEVLLELQRNGVQIFIATHDYVLAKYFEVRRKPTDKVMFYSLYNSPRGVQCTKSVSFKDLRRNPIVEAFDQLLDEVYDKSLGD